MTAHGHRAPIQLPDPPRTQNDAIEREDRGGLPLDLAIEERADRLMEHAPATSQPAASRMVAEDLARRQIAEGHR